jgi:hypothetical protein
VSRTKLTFTVCAIGSGVLIVVAALFGLRAYSSGNLSQARRIATQLRAAAISNPNPVVATPTTARGHGATHTAAPPASSAAHGAALSTSVAAQLGAPGTSAASSPTTAATSSVPHTSSPATTKAASTTGATHASTAVAAPATVPRTQPTAAEVQQAIVAVHALVPFYTPTAADIAAAGNDVCTAFDQGDSLAQVQTAALNMIGAASFSSFIPAADTDVAIQTLVALYCPGYGSRVG